MRECSYDFSKKNATNGCIYIYIIKKAKTYFWPLYYRGVFILVFVFSKVSFYSLSFHPNSILVLVVSSITKIAYVSFNYNKKLFK